MLSLLCGVVAYTMTFVLITFCYRRFKAKRNAKRGSSATRKLEETENSNTFFLFLLSTTLAFIALRSLCSQAVLASSFNTERDYSCGTSDVLLRA
jgi:multisubunit Na+/H+ antiporter MnhB subunit